MILKPVGSPVVRDYIISVLRISEEAGYSDDRRHRLRVD